jgi:hypothetical protein
LRADGALRADIINIETDELIIAFAVSFLETLSNDIDDAAALYTELELGRCISGRSRCGKCAHRNKKGQKNGYSRAGKR